MIALRKLIRTAMLPPIIILTAACGNDSSTHVPKPTAYHRLPSTDSIFSPVEIPEVKLYVNSCANTHTESRQGGEWLNITYPPYPGADVYLTITPTQPSNFNAIIKNREERITLDTGGMTTEITQLTSAGGWNCMLFVTRSSVTTPIHLLAANPEKTKVLSGTLHITSPSNPHITPDSIAPIVTDCARDLLTMLKNIADK